MNSQQHAQIASFIHSRRTFVLVLATLTCSVAFAQDPAPIVPPANKENFHIYLLMGQSNMVGRDSRNLPPPLNNPRVLALDAKGQWILAQDPLPHPDPKKVGVGPGTSFALEMLKADPTITIGLIPCAWGGSPLSRWVKGGDLYENAVKRAKIASGAGTIKGVLWHQGESDSSKEADAMSYGERLKKMFADLRADLESPNLPIVVGQLGDFIGTDKSPHIQTVRDTIKSMPSAVPHVGYAESAGLGHLGDKLHFTAESQRTMGSHFAAAMQELQKK